MSYAHCLKILILKKRSHHIFTREDEEILNTQSKESKAKSYQVRYIFEKYRLKTFEKINLIKLQLI